MPSLAPLVRRGLTLAVAIVLTGCAAMSEEECRTANWNEQGVRDAIELLGLCDRILVLWRGALAANLPTRGLTLDALLVAINGGQEPSP